MSDGQKAVSMMSVSPDPEVTPKAKRRIFSATYKKTYKKKILAEADAAAGSGHIGELLRREASSSSTLTRWHREREAAVEAAFSPKRGPEPKHNYLSAEKYYADSRWLCMGDSRRANDDALYGSRQG